MRFSKSKSKLLHMGQGSPGRKHKLGREFTESIPAEMDMGGGVWWVKSLMCASSTRLKFRSQAKSYVVNDFSFKWVFSCGAPIGRWGQFTACVPVLWVYSKLYLNFLGSGRHWRTSTCINVFPKRVWGLSEAGLNGKGIPSFLAYNYSRFSFCT